MSATEFGLAALHDAQFQVGQRVAFLMSYDDSSHALAERFRTHVRGPAFPCVGAKSAVSRGLMRFVVGRDMRSARDDLRIYGALLEFTIAYREIPKMFQSLVVIYEGPEVLSEDVFEKVL